MSLPSKAIKVSHSHLNHRSYSRGATMIEFAVVGPMITLLGLAILQYGMMFFAKNQINHAAFMAARAGSVDHASLPRVRAAYIKALVPLYGGGRNATELAESYKKAAEDVGPYTQIELLNPTKESFDDWNDRALQAAIGNGKRVIPNSNLAYSGSTKAVVDQLGQGGGTAKLVEGAWVKTNSGQSLSDANLIKLRITQGYKPKIPLMGKLYTTYLSLTNSGQADYASTLIAAGRIPVVSHVVLHMQSDAIEPANPVSLPGEGNGGNPVNPNPDPIPAPVPDDGGASSSGGGSSDGNTPPCNVLADPNCTEHKNAEEGDSCPIVIEEDDAESLPADLAFEFDSAVLTKEGKEQLDQLVANLNEAEYDGIDLVGYTDPIGDEAYNLELSKKRAQAVKDYLVSRGMPADKITVQGRGEAAPKVTEEDCSGSANQEELHSCLSPNRRVDITVKNARLKEGSAHP